MATVASNTKAVPIHFLVGSDEDAVKKAAADLAAKLAPEDPMNLEIVDGRADSVDDAARSIEKVREAILTLPFFGGGKLVWWKAVNFFDETGVGRERQFGTRGQPARIVQCAPPLGDRQSIEAGEPRGSQLPRGQRAVRALADERLLFCGPPCFDLARQTRTSQWNELTEPITDLRRNCPSPR